MNQGEGNFFANLNKIKEEEENARKSIKFAEDKKKEEPLNKPASSVDDLLLSYYTPERNQIFIPRPARSLFQRRKDREAERFIRQFMEAGDYNEEQKEFLIRCLEKGDSLDFIREFASPKLSVEHMAWLRKIVGRRIRYGR